jgi:predicted HicB family RNase H-like nuclease
LKRLSVTLDTALHKRLKLYAAYADVTMNDVVIEALREYLLKNSNVGPKSAADE